jgi:hypothetical protein
MAGGDSSRTPVWLIAAIACTLGMLSSTLLGGGTDTPAARVGTFVALPAAPDTPAAAAAPAATAAAARPLDARAAAAPRSQLERARAAAAERATSLEPPRAPEPRRDALPTRGAATGGASGRPLGAPALGASSDSTQYDALDALARADRLPVDRRASGLFPRLLVLGTSKGGSTFLFDCLHVGLHARAVCGADVPPDQWLGPACAGAGKHFLLPALRVHVSSRAGGSSVSLNPIKEHYMLTRRMYHGGKARPARLAYYRGPRLPFAFWYGQTARRAGGGARVTGGAEALADIDALLAACAVHAGQPPGGCPLQSAPAAGAAGKGAAGAGAHLWVTADNRIGGACGVRAAGGRQSHVPAPEALLGSRCAGGPFASGGHFLSDVRAFPPLPDGAADEDDSAVVSVDACPYYLAETMAPSLLFSLAPKPAVSAARVEG